MTEAATCGECGTSPVHPDCAGWLGYCRECAERKGHVYAFRVMLDTDKLLAFCEKLSHGDDEAARVLRATLVKECVVDF